jgi:hypothetical protein
MSESLKATNEWQRTGIRQRETKDVSEGEECRGSLKATRTSRVKRPSVRHTEDRHCCQRRQPSVRHTEGRQGHGTRQRPRTELPEATNEAGDVAGDNGWGGCEIESLKAANEKAPDKRAERLVNRIAENE